MIYAVSRLHKNLFPINDLDHSDNLLSHYFLESDFMTCYETLVSKQPVSHHYILCNFCFGFARMCNTRQLFQNVSDQMEYSIKLDITTTLTFRASVLQLAVFCLGSVTLRLLGLHEVCIVNAPSES